MAINIGDRYIIEIAEKYRVELTDGTSKIEDLPPRDLYRVRGIPDTFFLGDNFDKLDKYDSNNDNSYQRGLDDAWEIVQKVFRFEKDGGMSYEELEKIFGTEFTAEIANLPLEKVMSTLTDYEAKKKAEEEEIKVGDEVIQSFTHHEGVVVKLPLEGDIVTVLEKTGYAYGTPINNLKKTGRHFPQVGRLLDVMRVCDEEP